MSTCRAGGADRVYRMLYDDIANDQRFYNIFAFLILVGAAFAAFNLTGRMVEAQRREIGIGMALGVPPQRLAIRPLLVGARSPRSASCSASASASWSVSSWDRCCRASCRSRRGSSPSRSGPSPRAQRSGSRSRCSRRSTAVVRAIRVAPVDAIRTGALTGRGRVPLLARIPLPGRTTEQLAVPKPAPHSTPNVDDGARRRPWRSR